MRYILAIEDIKADDTIPVKEIDGAKEYTLLVTDGLLKLTPQKYIDDFENHFIYEVNYLLQVHAFGMELVIEAGYRRGPAEHLVIPLLEEEIQVANKTLSK